MIRRLLALVLGAVAALWLVRRVQVRWAARSVHGQGSAVPRFEGAMVRDRICKTFLPRSRALSLRDGEQEHFFCSEACRGTFLAKHRTAR